MQHLLRQFQRAVFHRRPMSCEGCLHPFPQYPIPCSWWWFAGSPPISEAVGRVSSTTQCVLGSCQPAALSTCASLASSVFVKSGGRCSITGLSAAKVSALPISPDLQDGLQRLGIRRLAEVQRICLLRALGGTSLVVAANPGSGKTLAYLLPVLQRFVAEDGRQTLDISDGSPPSPFALILVPSRELARQVAKVAMALLPHAPVLLLDPASSLRHHQQLLSHLPVKIVVSTPDRVRSLMWRRCVQAAGRAEHGEPLHLSLKNLHVLVIDEADCMLRRDYHSKVQFIYRTAIGCNSGEEKAGTGEGLRECRKSLQLLCFSAVLPPDLLETVEVDFPHAEVLNLLNGAKHGVLGGIDGKRQAPAGTLQNKNGSPGLCNSKGCMLVRRAIVRVCPNYDCVFLVSPMWTGSAVVGAGVRHHICYIPSWSGSNASQDTICDGSKALAKNGGRRSGQIAEEVHIEKERKMLALAESLRAFIPRCMHGSRRSNTCNMHTGSLENEARLPVNRDAPHENASQNTLEKHSVGTEGEEPNSAASVQPPAEGKFSREAESHSEEGPPQCIVFADSQEEVRPLSWLTCFSVLCLGEYLTCASCYRRSASVMLWVGALHKGSSVARLLAHCFSSFAHGLAGSRAFNTKFFGRRCKSSTRRGATRPCVWKLHSHVVMWWDLNLECLLLFCRGSRGSKMRVHRYCGFSGIRACQHRYSR